MVPIMRLFRNLPALFALVCATTGQGADTIYRKVGDSVVLNPGQPFNAISSATWKHNTDLASEWFGTGNVDCYRDFKDRCSLNKKDGSFTISNLKVEDSGIYTPEINDKVLNALKLQVIKPVPKPTVSVKCNNEKTRCNLTCEANISADVGTVTYEWRTGEEVLSNNKELIITENKESSFICELENRVSSSSSDGVDNPISSGNPGAAAGLAAAIVILIVAAALAVIGRFGWYWFKNRKFPTWKEFWCCGKKKAKGNDAESAEGNKLLPDASEKSDLEAKIYKDQETNAMRPTETLQIVNENGEALPGHNKEKDGTSNSGSAEGNETYELARETQTEDNDLSNNGKKTDDQHKEPAEDPSSKNHGDFSAGKQLTTASEGEASFREKYGTNISQSTEEANQNRPPVNPVPSGLTEGDAPPGENKDKAENNKVGDDKQGKQPLPGVTNTNITAEADDETSPKVNEEKDDDETSPRVNEEKDDQHQKSALKSSSEKLGEQHVDSKAKEIQQPTKGTKDKTSPREEETDDQLKKSALKSSSENQGKSDQDSNPEDIQQPTKGTKDKTSPREEEKDDQLKKSALNSSSENQGKSDQDSNPEDIQQPTKGTNPDQKLADESSSVDQGDSSTGEQSTKESDTSNLKSAEEANQNRPSVSPETGGPPDVKVSSSDEEKAEDKDSPNNCKKTDDQDKDPAEDSSSENQVEQHLDSNPKQTQHPNDGTENTSVEPSGPETSEEVSAV